jgi:hypothetical protein
MKTTRSGLARFVLNNSLLLLAGTAFAVLWANVHLGSYVRAAHPLHFVVNDIGMVFFFALAAKEVFEATRPGGALASPRRAFSPLAAAVGGMALPALIYLALIWWRGPAELARGWAIPCATDIAFSAMVARIVFPAGHPADSVSTSVSTRNRNVPVLREIEMSPAEGRRACGSSWKTRGFSKQRWARPGRPRLRQLPRALQRLAARLSARSCSSARVSRRHGWSALGRAGRCGALDSRGRAAAGVGVTGGAISVHFIRRPR